MLECSQIRCLFDRSIPAWDMLDQWIDMNNIKMSFSATKKSMVFDVSAMFDAAKKKARENAKKKGQSNMYL